MSEHANPESGWYVITNPNCDQVECVFRYQSGNWALPGGHSAVLPACWTLGPRIDDLLRDAARYQWIVSHPGRMEDLYAACNWEPVYETCSWRSPQVDALIDAEIAREKQS